MEERTSSRPGSGLATNGLNAPSNLQIIMLSAAGFGVEYAYAVEAGYAVPAMLSIGLPETFASIMWAVGPFLGLLFQGYMGSASDRSKCAWGKRRPFILGLTVAVCLSLVLFPYGQALSENILGLSKESGAVFVMVFTAFTFVAMDFSLDAIQSPIRAYLLDSVSSERSEKANYTYAALLSLGALVGSLISGIPWAEMGRQKNSALSFNIQIELIFGTSTAVFVVCIILCLNSIKENNPDFVGYLLPLSNTISKKRAPLMLEKSFAEREKSLSWVMNKKELGDRLKPQLHIMRLWNGRSMSPEPRKIATSSTSSTPQPPPPSSSLHLQPPLLPKKRTTRIISYLKEFFKGAIESVSGTIIFSQYISQTFFMLWLAVFLNWCSYLSMYLFFTSFVGEVVYGGSPRASNGDATDLYSLGVRVGCLMFVGQDAVCIVCSVSMQWFSDVIGVRVLYLGGLMAYVIVSGITALWPTLLNAMLLQLVSGVMYTNLLSLPYTLTSHYEASSLLLSHPLPNNKETTGKAVSFLYMSMFVAQLIIGTTMGFLIKTFNTHRVTIVVSFGSSCLALVSAMQVKIS